MILIHHFLLHAITPCSFPLIYKIFNPFFYCGVDLFFMISGWFGITLSLKSFVKIVIVVSFYSVLNLVLCYITSGNLSLSDFCNILLFPITKSRYWFIIVYVLLMLMAPLINRGLDRFSILQLRSFTLILTVFTFFSCNIGYNRNNPDGSNFVNALYLYCLSYYIRKDYSIFDKFNKLVYIAIYSIALVMIGLLSIKINILGNISNYNSSLMIIASASLFIFFTKFKFKSRLVNLIAGSALGCYLLQDGRWGKEWLYAQLHSVYVSFSPWECFLIYGIVGTLIWIVSISLTPIVDGLVRFSYEYLEKISTLKKLFDFR